MKIRLSLTGILISNFNCSGVSNFLQWNSFIVALFFFVFINPSVGQVYPYQNFSVQNGLINSNVYDITQDSIGYMWLATENGISRFNGIDFENYSLSNLNVNSFISSIYSTKNGDVYFGCGINGIYQLESISGKIKKINKSDVSQSNQIIIKDDYLISLHEYHNYDFLKISDGTFLSVDSISLNNSINKALSMIKLKNNRILLGRSDGLYEFKNGYQQKLIIKGFKNKPVYSIYENKNGHIYLGSDGMIYKIKEDVVYDSSVVVTGEELRVRNIIVDKEAHLWFNVWGTRDIYMISGAAIINVSEKLNLKNASVTKMFLDNTGNIWAGMLGKGVYLFTNFYLLNYPSSADLPASNIKKIIKSSNGKFLLGTNDGIGVLDPHSKTITSYKQMPEMTQYVRKIIPVGQNNYVIAITDIRLNKPFLKDYALTHEPVHIRYSHGSSLWSDSSALWVGNWDNSIIQYQLPDFKFIRKIDSVFTNESSKLRINSILKDNYNRFWIGSQQGYQIMTNNCELVDFPKTKFKSEISNIIALPSNRILIVSHNGFEIFQNNETVSKIECVFNMNIENTTCVSVTGNDEFLVGTKDGLYFIENNTRNLLTIHDGILSDEINEIYLDSLSRIAIVGTTEGVMELQLNKLKASLIATYKIDDVFIKIGDSLFRPEKELNLSYKQNSFTLKFHTFNYTNPVKIKYQYRLDNGEWNLAPTREIQFASLEPGSHIIQIRSGTSSASWGPTYDLLINISPPFYRTLWFYFLTSVGAFLLVFIFIKKQLNKIRIKQEEKSATQQKLIELQQKALASNLNPHFIFNSLNSIQHFINSHNSAEANDYLSKFSRLMRMQLNMADKSFITLHEEISRLEFYLSLEQMRFGEKLTWQINVDPAIDPYMLEIPNMIIQPFIENAIWHGIMPSSVPGHILLNLEISSNQTLLITVTDNGVGYGQNKTTTDPKHESKGVKLITDRLTLLDPNASNLLVFENAFPGTKVTISLTAKMYRMTGSGNN